MKKALLLLFFLGCVFTARSQTRSTQWTFTPTLSLGYKLSDWLYGTPLGIGIQGQLITKEKVLLETWAHATSFKDVIFQDQKFGQFIGNFRVRHSIQVAGIGIGYAIPIRKQYLQLSGGMVVANYNEPYVTSTGGMIFSSNKLEHYSHVSTGLYGKIQLNLFLRDNLYLTFGSTALSCRSVSYGIIQAGCTLTSN